MSTQLCSDRTATRPTTSLPSSLPAGAAAQRGGPYAVAAALAALQAWIWTSSVVPKLTSTTFVHGLGVLGGFVTLLTTRCR